MQDLIKNWAAKQNDHPSLAAAIRRLVELGLKGKGEIMIKHARPAPVLNVFTVTIDGVTHRGTYYVQDSVVHVQCDAGKKATQVGRLPERSLAKLLLSELVHKQRK